MTLNIGWIGCGRHASQMLLPQLVRHDVRLAAICDLEAARLAEVGRQYGVTAAYSDPRELLAHPGLDAVGMAVGPAVHLKIGLAAMQRGLPVFMEKPPGSNRKEAEQLAEAAERAGLPLTVGFMKRYSTGNLIARSIVAGPEFGRPAGFYGSYMTAPTYFSGNVDYSAFFLHHCIHYMDLPAHLMGPINSLDARRVEIGRGKLLLHVSLGFEGGAIGTLVMGTIQSRGTPMEFVQVMGDHQRVEVENVINVTHYRDPPFKAADPAATLREREDTLCWRPNFTAASNEDFKGYDALLRDTLLAFRGEANDAPTIADGVRAMAWLDRLKACVEEQ